MLQSRLLQVLSNNFIIAEDHAYIAFCNIAKQILVHVICNKLGTRLRLRDAYTIFVSVGET